MALQPLFQKHEISTEDVVWKVTISFYCCYFTDANQSSELLLSNVLNSALVSEDGVSVMLSHVLRQTNRTVKKCIQI